LENLLAMGLYLLCSIKCVYDPESSLEKSEKVIYMNIIQMAKQFKEGVKFCRSCLKQTITKQSPDPSAFSKALSSGKFRPAESGECIMCGAKAEYKVKLRDAMKAIKKSK